MTKRKQRRKRRKLARRVTLRRGHIGGRLSYCKGRRTANHGGAA